MEQAKQTVRKTVPIRLFSDREAWTLFKLAAFSEAIGWTLLIIGILIKHYWTPGIDTPVRIAGEIHGTIFLFYLATTVIAAGSMSWSYGLTFIAGLASVPPYGTLVFEQIMARTRHKTAQTALRQVTVRAIIVNKKKLLAYQPQNGVDWLLPGGELGFNESAAIRLEEMVHSQTGVKPVVHGLAYVYENHHKGEQLELFFYASGNFTKLKPGKLIDELSFIDPRKTSDLVPVFLQTATLGKDIKTPTAQFLSSGETE